MTRFSPVLAFLLIYFLHPDFGECVTVILGDSYVFRNCQTDGQAYLYRVVEGKSAQHITGKVATREEDVWKPAKDYEDRMKIKAFIAFSRTEYSDTGLYELRCPGQPDNSTQLDIVLASEVLATEGGNATLPCYYITGGHVESIKWSRGGEMVLEQNLSSGEIKHGPGFKKRLSLSPDGNKKGNWALMFNPVLLEDGGDYFCSFHQNQNGAPEGRGDPAAVRMRVAERRRDQTTGRPYLTPTQKVTEGKEKMGTWAVVSITAAVVFVIVAPSFFLLGWTRCLKSRCSSFRPGSIGGRYSDVPSLPPPPQANGDSPSNNAQAESTV